MLEVSFVAAFAGGVLSLLARVPDPLWSLALLAVIGGIWMARRRSRRAQASRPPTPSWERGQ
jgi:hypothetical protein